jgi:hypothetical protein
MPLHVISENTPADVAWERYQSLVKQANSENLWGDRKHVESMLRAYEKFRWAFLATGQP